MKRFFLLLIVLPFISCILRLDGKWLAEGGYRPIKPKFRLSKEKFTLPYNSVLDTDALYFTRGDKYKAFYRFWKNGRVYHSPGHTSLPEDYRYYNETRKGFIGYYKIEENNEITIELFYPVMGNAYLQNYGTVFGDSIIIDRVEDHLIPFKTRKRKLKKQYVNRLYKFKPAWLFLYSQPYW
ncbi:MAG: hypothetical protein H6696_20650 [Deferribacteres bacterium]|nr:hypothetical protein [candidate division KSB1 bacterium]MCB9504342.1 hypothetical protein [Deferribacteres bacterium]